jgi:uncharacterized repeat protein (TIGR03803 family)
VQSKEQSCNLISDTILCATKIALEIAIVCALTVVLTQSVQAQTFELIHTFNGGGGGATPVGPLIMDHAGNFYGTTLAGGRGTGTAFRLSKRGSKWLLNPLYTFSGEDGSSPWAGVIMSSNGLLYGTTEEGGSGNSGVVYSLQTTAAACESVLCPWTETVLHSFTGGADGADPESGHLIFDQAGNLYGVTLFGGAYGSGTVFELVRSQSGWTEEILHSFNGSDGSLPDSALTFENLGNLYGTTLEGGAFGQGTVFQLTPSESGWTENVLYSFTGGNDGAHPYPGPMFDPSGRLYGGTAAGGEGNGGTVFRLIPSGGVWTYELIYSLAGNGGDCGPVANFVMDAAGSLYASTNYEGAYNAGTVFKLTPSGGSWTYTLLYTFTGGSDGESPGGGLLFDQNGNLYGIAVRGGAQGDGTVWEIAFP